MKKLLSILMVVAMFSFVACGPSAEEKAAEQAKLDSIAAANIADSMLKVEAEQFKLDSIALADSLAKLQTAKPTKK